MPEGITLSSILDWSSYKRFKRLDAAFDTKLPKTILPCAFKFKRKGRGEHMIPSSEPINFSDMDTSMLEEVHSRLIKSKYDFDSIESICPYNLLFEIKRTYYALLFWWETPGTKRYTIEHILRHTLLTGPSYAKLLSDEWDYGIRRRFRVSGIAQDYSSWKPIMHYNELPPIAYLMRWQEICDDIKYMKLPLGDFDQDLLEELRNEILDSLPESLELPADIEILAEVKTSTSFDLDNWKTIPFFKARQMPLGSQFSQIFKGKRSIVPVGPANYRDAVVTAIDTYNSIKWCDLVMGRLLDNQEESLVHSDPQVFNKRLRSMTKIPRRGQMYWLRDIKKCGLTFPRELLHLVQECLSETYPDKDFSRFNIYRYYSIWDENNKPVETIRGYGLGMANNLVTYIQCMLSKMLLKRIPNHINVEALYGNDDSCLKIWTEDGVLDHIDAMMIQDEDFGILKGLNIITHDDKSFWSFYPIIFEEYGHENFKIKHSRIACALSSCMLAPDIKYAKFLTSSISLALWSDGDWIEPIIRRITSYWGYEYFKEEVNYDYLLGGWFSIRSKGMNPMLRMIQECPYELIQPMWTAMQQMNSFLKKVIRPVIQGTVTKNYSVTGRIANITYVDLDIYDIPELPVETIYLDKKGFNDFYESIYKFNRNPYAEMARRLRQVTSFSVGRPLDRDALTFFALENFNKLAIPKRLVTSESPVFEIRKNSNLDCYSLLRNSLSRYLGFLKDKHLIMYPGSDLPSTGEYPFVVSYDSTPYVEKICGVTDLEGNIPEGIYQYSTNPWLPLYEYVMEYDTFPTGLIRIREDRSHLPIWFMNRSYRDSREVSIAYINMDLGELFVDSLIELLREGSSEYGTTVEESTFKPNLCYFCRSGFYGWEEETDIYTINDDSCTVCILGDHIWRARRLSQMSSNMKERLENLLSVPKLRSRMEYLIDTYFPVMIASKGRFCQSPEESYTTFLADNAYQEGILMEMFG